MNLFKSATPYKKGDVVASGENLHACVATVNEKTLTATQTAKQYGITLKEVADISGVKIRTLHNWCKVKPDTFKVIVIGSVGIRANVLQYFKKEGE